ncbi:MFS transporter [Actinoplanes sp. NBRC 103695]|nr:MFS transporter [Actinoplanes sp. NBRC 103695]GLY95065.1 MFS transporter [Actinoplanes sp. NBRC 103695]
MYALLFADTGLTTAEISSLFVIWSVVAFTAEIPSGAWADTWSRRRLYVLGAALTAAGFLTWTLWTAYPGFALGFVLWGLGGALCSGTLEALLYDSLADPDDYARVAGRGGTIAILSMLAATLLATPVFLLGGYVLVGVASVLVALAAGGFALGFPESRGEGSDKSGYLDTLRAGLRHARTGKHVVWALTLAALVPGFTALDEYIPLVTRATGVPVAYAGLFFAVPALFMALGSELAGRWAHCGPRVLGAVLAAAAALLAAGGLSRHAAGMLPIGAAFGLLQFAIVLSETRLQEVTPSAVRATVLSVSGFAAEVVAVALYLFFGLGAAYATVPVLFALVGIPLLGTATVAAAGARHVNPRPESVQRVRSGDGGQSPR